MTGKQDVPPPQQPRRAADSSTDESGNDSFTCSEFEYDTYEKVDDPRDAPSPPMARKNSGSKVMLHLSYSPILSLFSET